MEKESSKIKYFSEELSKKNKNKSNKQEENRFNCLYNDLKEEDKDLVNKYIDSFREFYNKVYSNGNEYKLYNSNEIIERYFEMIDQEKLPLFDEEEDAITVAKFIMNPALDIKEDIFVSIDKVITINGLFYTLSFNNITDTGNYKLLKLENFMCNDDMYYTFNFLKLTKDLICAIQEGKITKSDMEEFINKQKEDNDNE